MQVVVEYVLAENFVLSFCVLKTVGLLLHEKAKHIFLAAIFGAMLTVALPALYLSRIGWLFVQLGLMILNVCLCFKFDTLKKFFQIFLCHLVANFVFGGAIFFASSAIGQQNLVIVLLAGVAAYGVAAFVLGRHHRKKQIEKFCFDVVVEQNGVCQKCRAFLDSGNMLTDPVTQSPVSLINFKMFCALFSDIDISDILHKSEKLQELPLAHYINFGTLNGNDKILVFQVDRLQVNGRVQEKSTLGLCFKNFRAAFGSDMILNNSFFQE